MTEEQKRKEEIEMKERIEAMPICEYWDIKQVALYFRRGVSWVRTNLVPKMNIYRYNENGAMLFDKVEVKQAQKDMLQSNLMASSKSA